MKKISKNMQIAWAVAELLLSAFFVFRLYQSIITQDIWGILFAVGVGGFFALLGGTRLQRALKGIDQDADMPVRAVRLSQLCMVLGLIGLAGRWM